MEEKDCPVPGWKRLVCQRKSGKTAGKSDVYYVNPTGKRLRSRREVLKYLKETGLDIPLDSFCFQTREHLSGFTEIKKKKITQGCTPAAHSVYFAKDKTKNKDVVTNIEKCSCCCEDKVSGSRYYSPPIMVQIDQKEIIVACFPMKTVKRQVVEQQSINKV